MQAATPPVACSNNQILPACLLIPLFSRAPKFGLLPPREFLRVELRLTILHIRAASSLGEATFRRSPNRHPLDRVVSSDMSSYELMARSSRVSRGDQEARRLPL